MYYVNAHMHFRQSRLYLTLAFKTLCRPSSGAMGAKRPAFPAATAHPAPPLLGGHEGATGGHLGHNQRNTHPTPGSRPRRATTRPSLPSMELSQRGTMGGTGPYWDAVRTVHYGTVRVVGGIDCSFPFGFFGFPLRWS